MLYNTYIHIQMTSLHLSSFRTNVLICNNSRALIEFHLLYKSAAVICKFDTYIYYIDRVNIW